MFFYRGAEPKQLAFSTALGLTLGVFPICGKKFAGVFLSLELQMNDDIVQSFLVFMAVQVENNGIVLGIARYAVDSFTCIITWEFLGWKVDASLTASSDRLTKSITLTITELNFMKNFWLS